MRSEYDHCAYFQKLENGILIILVIYVDDILIERKIMVEMNRLKAQLVRTLKMKDLGAKNKSLAWRYVET